MKKCSACEGNVSIDAKVCPHCGHQLTPAATWVASIILILFVVLALALGMGS